MKKKLLLFLTIFTLVFVTGCFGKKQEELKPVDVLEKAVLNLGEVKSLETISTIKMKVVEDGASVEINVPLTVAISEVKNGMNIKLALGDNPFLGNMEAYFIGNPKNKMIELYFPSSIYDMMLGIESEDSKWLYTSATLEEKNEDPKFTLSDEDLEKLKNIDYKKVIGDNFVYVDSTEGINHYQLIINNDLIQRFVVETGGEFEEFANEIKLDVYIDETYYNFTKIGANLKEFIEVSESGKDQEMFNSIEEFLFTMEFKNVNNTVVTVPEEVKNNAIDLEQYMDILGSMEN